MFAMQEFEQNWHSFAAAPTMELELLFLPPPSFWAHIDAAHLVCLASGQQGDSEVHYYYAQDVHTSYFFLLQISVCSTSLKMAIAMKGQDRAALTNFIALFRALLTPKDRGGIRWIAPGQL
jgi:hypothetical protein